MGLGYGNRSKGIYNFGVNDLDYDVVHHDTEGKMTWKCPYYTKWYSMLNRCYSKKYRETGPSYDGVRVDDVWRSVKTFRSWMEGQKWEGMQLDKDILVEGNKVYSPTTCCLVPRYINNLLCDHRAGRGENPLGTHWHKATQKYCASISGMGSRVHVGLYTDVHEAHKAWQWKKAEVIESTVSKWKSSGCESFRTDVAEALNKRAWNLRLQHLNGKETINFQ